MPFSVKSGSTSPQLIWKLSRNKNLSLQLDSCCSVVLLLAVSPSLGFALSIPSYPSSQCQIITLLPVPSSHTNSNSTVCLPYELLFYFLLFKTWRCIFLMLIVTTLHCPKWPSLYPAILSSSLLIWTSFSCIFPPSDHEESSNKRQLEIHLFCCHCSIV